MFIDICGTRFNSNYILSYKKVNITEKANTNNSKPKPIFALSIIIIHGNEKQPLRLSSDYINSYTKYTTKNNSNSYTVTPIKDSEAIVDRYIKDLDILLDVGKI